MIDISLHGDHEHGAAWRRRQRRLTGGTSSSRCGWPWQQPFITAVMLGRVVQRSTEPEDCQGRGVGARDELHGDDPGPPTPQPELFSFYEEEPGRVRPDQLSAVSAPQERDLRRTVQQIVDFVPLLPTLDDPAPQFVEQLPNTLSLFRALSPDPEQVIDPRTSLCLRPFAYRSWRNSWEKCHRSSPLSRSLNPGAGTGCALELMDAMSLAAVWCRWPRQ